MTDGGAGPTPGNTLYRNGDTKLRRTLTLPWLVFYGVGVTIGAGIFALIGELIGSSGRRAPLAFLVAGVIAGVTGISYMAMVRAFPRAGGEAIWVRRGLGDRAGLLAGVGVIAVGTISSAVVALAFGGYVSELVDVPAKVAAAVVVIVLSAVACRGVRESIMLAGGVTLLEVGTLVAVVIFGLPSIADADAITNVFEPADDGFTTAVLSGAIIAFFAFIGFEDIVNMAEETVDPRRTAPRAIAWTLGISVVIYVLLALIAVNVDDPNAIAESDAPMATLFEVVSGRGADTVSTVAALAMTNGILAQLMMAARVTFGMANDRADPGTDPLLGRAHRSWQTPIFATLGVTLMVILLVLIVPLVHLARLTSVIILIVFTMVNLTVFRLGRRREHELFAYRHVGLLGSLLAAPLAIWQAVDAIGAV